MRLSCLTLVAALVLLGLPACATDDSTGDPGGGVADAGNSSNTGALSCGDLTCDAGRFCLEDCRSCSGIDLGTGVRSRPEYECVVPPASCAGGAVQCFTQDLAYNNCDVQTDGYIYCRAG